MLNGPRGTKTQVHASGPPMPTVSPPQTGQMAGALANPYFSYPNMPPHPSLWPGYGQVPIYNLPFPPPHAQHYMVPPTTPALLTQPVDYPMITEWLAYCDNHPQHSGEDFNNLVPKFDKEGFRRLHQLTGDRIMVKKLSEWLGIGKGTADLILRYAEEDIMAIHTGTFQMLFGGHGQNLMQPQK
jgi:hypothetical protein